jgi:hypothetical protein
MNVTGLKAKPAAKDEPPPGSLNWAHVHDLTGPHVAAVKAVAQAGNDVVFTAAKTGIRRWDTTTGRYG